MRPNSGRWVATTAILEAATRSDRAGRPLRVGRLPLAFDEPNLGTTANIARTLWLSTLRPSFGGGVVLFDFSAREPQMLVKAVTRSAADSARNSAKNGSPALFTGDGRAARLGQSQERHGGGEGHPGRFAPFDRFAFSGVDNPQTMPCYRLGQTIRISAEVSTHGHS